MKKIPQDRVWVELYWWYDWISHRQDKEGNRYSRFALLPLEDNELCKHGKIYKVEKIWEYTYNILSERDDK